MTPPDTNGRLVGAIKTFGTPPINGSFPTELASPLRDSIVFFAYSSPLLSPGGANGIADVYETERRADGWMTTRRMSPPGSAVIAPTPGGVAPDHLYTSTNAGNGSMSLGGGTDYLANPDGTYELTGPGSLGDEPFVQTRWISDGGNHVIFTTGEDPKQSVWCFEARPDCAVLRLEPTAAATGTGAIYDRSADGPTHVISLLPGDVTPLAGEEAFYQGASRDGSSVAFRIGGVLYVRVDRAETLEVAGGEPSFAGLSADGRYLFYLAAGNIHRFDTATEADEQVNASGDAEVVNVSADGSHVYFISESQLDGANGTAGQPNMYVWSGGPPAYVATVAPSDLEGLPSLANWTSSVLPGGGATQYGLGANSSRTTPDGEVLIFESRAQLTSYDNAEHTAIYRYDDGSKSLLCVSCNPTAEPASADAHLQNLTLTTVETVINNVTDDGARVFFETPEALVSGETTGVNDIYEWQEEGEGGIVDLISSGQSIDYSPKTPQTTFYPTPNVLLSVTPDGEDVVFLSQDVLVPGAGEGGTQAIYDARVGGGISAPPPPPICAEEGCRLSSQLPPSLLGPQSEIARGDGNVKPRKHKKRCRRASKPKKHKRCDRKKAARSLARPSSARLGRSDEGVPDIAPLTAAANATDGLFESDEAAQSKAAPIAAAESFDEFGIQSVNAGQSTSTASVPLDFTTDITLNHTINEKSGFPEAEARTEEVSISLPPGLLANPRAIPRCSMGDFLKAADCPIDSQVGVSTIITILLSRPVKEPVYNLEPPHPDREIARFGLYGAIYPVFIDVAVRTAGDYGATATVHSSPGLTALLGAKTTIWGNPADPSHDEERLTTGEAINCPGTACEAPGGKRESGLDPTVFMTNPSACQAQEVGFVAKSYQLPGQVFSASAPMDPITGCTGIPFDPSFEAQPTTRVAGAPTGLKTTLVVPQQSSEDVDSPATATMREAKVTLPEGLTIAAGAADGLAACSEAQVGYKQEIDAACPDASKLGTATITSPALPRPLQGTLYQRTPRPGNLFGLWLVTDELGLHVKLPGEIKPNPNTGQLTATFSDLPQVPVEEIALNVWGGPRAPLKNPDSCGTYATAYTFTPHSNDPAVSGQNQMTIDQGCGGGGFSPQLHAGVTQPVAGAFSPFVLDLTRFDGEQNLGALEITLPKGELAKIAGVGLCPDAAAVSGNCPAASRIGSLTAAVGPGPQPLWLPQPGKSPTAVYLSGPYKGAPFSVVTVVPAQAGPFDLGVVTVRSALEVDPETAQATVKSDPLPQFIEGVAAVYRRLHVVVDRPGFSLNPTNCKELAVTSKITSTKGAVANPSARFQVDGCKALKFKPKLTLRLKGGAKRGDYPALSATVKARKGDANIGRVSVALPHSEFLAQEHIRTICTRKRFAVDNCPKGSVYGRAKAWTPLLDRPLEGPVYLRSSDNPLPDLVMAMGGELDVDLVGRIDSKNGGIRTTFDTVPDAPVTKFVLKMRGGNKSLLVNSQNICRGAHRATVRMRAQNGRIFSSRPPLKNASCRGR